MKTLAKYISLVRCMVLALLLPGTSLLRAADTPDNEKPSHRFSFTWGGELGAGIDLTDHDMSDININAYFGMKSAAFPLLGVGAGIDMMMSNSSRMFPVFAIVQTNFGATRSPVFADLRVGCAFDNVGSTFHKTRLYAAPGFGINFAQGRKYRSYMIVSAVFNNLDYNGNAPGLNPSYGRIKSLWFGNVAIGVTF